MTKDGNLSEREMRTLNKAWGILSKWTEIQERDAESHGYEPDTDYCYTNAMYAVVGLCEFMNNYGKEA